MKNRLKLIETTTVCCVCGTHLSGPWPAAGQLSHGYCKVHHQLAMREVEKYFALLDRQHTTVVHAQAA
jgi:predicted HNH restriction endonuclease